MKEIEPNVEHLRYYVGEIKPTMHPGDYADTLAIIVHYALIEAERLSQLTGDRGPLVAMAKELIAVSSFHDCNLSSMN